MTPAQIATIVAQARNRAGLTQSQLAERAGVTQSVISRLERGQGGLPNVNTLVRVAEALGGHLQIDIVNN